MHKILVELHWVIYFGMLIAIYAAPIAIYIFNQVPIII